MSLDSFWRDRRVLITGASGFLGSWMCKTLESLGAEITVLVRDFVGSAPVLRSPMIEHVNIVKGSLENYATILRTVQEYEIKTCFHLAAQSLVTIGIKSPLSTFESNIRGTWNLLEACRKSETIEEIVVASSDKAYGNNDNVPYTEDQPLSGESPYEVSKSCADLISRTYFRTYSLPVAVARCGNIYGGGDLNYNRLIPGTIRSLLLRKPPIIRSNGKLLRDYLYIKDTVSGYLLLAQRTSTANVKGQAFNFGTGTPTPVIKVVDLIRKIMHADHLRPIFRDQKLPEIVEQYLSCEKAKKFLGWSHKYNLPEGLEETIDWYRKYVKKNN